MEEVWRIAEPQSGLAELAKVRFRAEYPAATGRASHKEEPLCHQSIHKAFEISGRWVLLCNRMTQMLFMLLLSSSLHFSPQSSFPPAARSAGCVYSAQWGLLSASLLSCGSWAGWTATLTEPHLHMFMVWAPIPSPRSYPDQYMWLKALKSFPVRNCRVFWGD